MRPSRIHPESGSNAEARVVTFRDGPQLVPDHLAAFALQESYPVTYQEWVSRMVNSQNTQQFTAAAISSVRSSSVG